MNSPEVANSGKAVVTQIGEPGDSFAVDDPVSDQAHGARDTIGAPVPIG